VSRELVTGGRKAMKSSADGPLRAPIVATFEALLPEREGGSSD
jgi:hypothetical protein